jgi:hypothetical protein
VASLVIIAVVLVLAFVLGGAYLAVCLAIRREDRVRGSLRYGAASQSAQSARTLVGLSSSRE